MVSAIASAVLAATAVGCLLGVPPAAGLRLQHAVPGPDQRRAASSVSPTGRRVRGRAGAVRALAALVLLGLVVGAAGPAGPRLPGTGLREVGPLGAALLEAGLRSAVPALLAVGAAVAAVRVRRRRRSAAARQEERARAVEACAALSAELRAGRSPADALLAAAEVAVGPCRTALTTAAGAARLGGSPAAALQPPPSTAVPDVLRSLAACWSVCAGTGSGLASAVERLEEGLRAEQAQRRAVQAELAGPRATAGLLAVLPAGGLLLAAGLGADPLDVLLSTPVGLVCLLGGLLLDGLGVWWTGRLVDRASGGR